MKKTILITGATDGIGLATARLLAADGHDLRLHGRNAAKLADVTAELASRPGAGRIESHAADLSVPADVDDFASSVTGRLDVLINNAGVFGATDPITGDGLDVRFAVNTIAPYRLTMRLLPLMGSDGRVVNLSSAAQASVDPRALTGEVRLSDGQAYAQSKLALTMWSNELARRLGDGPVIVAVNPGSFQGTKMVREAYGTAGKDIGIGADILRRAALSEEFAAASGRYFDNDSGRFAAPHADALDARKTAALVELIESIPAISGRTGP